MNERPPKPELWLEHAEKADHGGQLILQALDTTDLDTIERLVACQKTQAVLLAKEGISFDNAMLVARRMTD